MLDSEPGDLVSCTDAETRGIALELPRRFAAGPASEVADVWMVELSTQQNRTTVNDTSSGSGVAGRESDS